MSQWLISINGSVSQAYSFLKSQAVTFFIIRVLIIAAIAVIYHLWSIKKINKSIKENMPLSSQEEQSAIQAMQLIEETLAGDDSLPIKEKITLQEDLLTIKNRLTATPLSDKEIKRLKLIGNGWLCFAVFFGFDLLLTTI